MDYLKQLLGIQDEEKLYSEELENPMSLETEIEPVIAEPETIEQPEIEQVVEPVRQPASVESVEPKNPIEPKLSPQEELLNEFRKYRQQSQESIQDAREMDDQSRFSRNMANAFQTMGQGLASGYANVKMDPIKLEIANREKQARQDQQNKLQELMQAYKINAAAKKSPLEQRKLDLAERKLQIEEDKLNQAEKSPKKKDTIFEKELAKLEAKDYKEVQNKAIMAQEDDNKIDDAFNNFLEYSKGSKAGTGPIATLGGLTKYTDDELQAVDAQFKDLALSKMTKMFSGMSKAVDSDAERRAFEATAPSITNDDKVNAQILLGAKAVNLRNKVEAKAQQKYLEENGSMKGYKSPVMSKPTSVVVDPKSGKLRLLPKEQLDAAKKQGFLDLDEYTNALLGK